MYVHVHVVYVLVLVLVLVVCTRTRSVRSLRTRSVVDVEIGSHIFLYLISSRTGTYALIATDVQQLLAIEYKQTNNPFHSQKSQRDRR